MATRSSPARQAFVPRPLPGPSESQGRAGHGVATSAGTGHAGAPVGGCQARAGRGASPGCFGGPLVRPGRVSPSGCPQDWPSLSPLSPAGQGRGAKGQGWRPRGGCTRGGLHLPLPSGGLGLPYTEEQSQRSGLVPITPDGHSSATGTHTHALDHGQHSRGARPGARGAAGAGGQSSGLAPGRAAQPRGPAGRGRGQVPPCPVPSPPAPPRCPGAGGAAGPAWSPSPVRPPESCRLRRELKSA